VCTIDRCDCTAERGGKGKSDFVVSAYLESDDGEREAVLPRACPWGGEGECRVGRHSRRVRANGPEFALVVAVCREHGCFFTVYPPGWAPYLRAPLADVDAGDGRPRSQAWLATLFVAAVRAAAGELWPEESVGAPACARTQHRHIARCGELLGLSEEWSWESRASLLLVPLATMRDARQRWSQSSLRRVRGPTVKSVLDAFTFDESTWRRLVEAGTEAGLWGPAWWVGENGVLGRLFPS